MENNITINRELIIKPLQYVTNIISNRSIYPNLNNILVKFLDKGIILFKSTNLEIEITSFIKDKNLNQNHSFIIQGKKFYNICRSFTKGENINIIFNTNQIIISTKYSYFKITTLPAEDFPNIKFSKYDIKFNLTHQIIKDFINTTYFSIADNDVRKYLNGLCLQTKNNFLNIISTNGHRLSFYKYKLNNIFENYSIIIPRKSIFELSKLINNTNELVTIKINNNNICFTFKSMKFISKLISSNFPNYQKIIPTLYYQIIKINRILLKNALNRISILVNEKTKGVHLSLDDKYLKIFTKNVNNEKAKEILKIEEFQKKKEYNIKISFNINYLIDVINILDSSYIKIFFIDNISNIKIEDNNNENKFFLIMPMKI
ncbi:DNA polymerase III subunit beta [Enterobacteriaceae endosymbiont of Donacia provostii]|uniref:DNA polymerase III subunit beta n=1 Tax=Enterobacteriaceae endosymbiont of Donacia provostii TaxID=2675781 RepID=UPI001448F2BB|nr:DNA polymerase III subunit beta [Enterobacteriaceae endosymbiont of Donacia provostii]QJC33886.1 DNA polymerase III subunit beta [Enterobacteriaceae endosymbiont of Donacia provostii]